MINPAYIADTIGVNNVQALHILRRYLNNGNTYSSLGSICRKLPYMLMELAHRTSMTWYGTGTYNERRLCLTFYSQGDNGRLWNDRCQLHAEMVNSSIPNTLKRIVNRPDKLFKNVDPQIAQVLVLSNFGKGIYSIDELPLSNFIFKVHYQPVTPTFTEKLWCMKESFRLRNAASTTIKYAFPIVPDSMDDFKHN